MDLWVSGLGHGHSCKVHIRGLASQESIGLYPRECVSHDIVHTTYVTTDGGSELGNVVELTGLPGRVSIGTRVQRIGERFVVS